MQATDQGSSPRSASQPATVTINVIRNQFPPVFVNTPYATSLPFTVAAGSSVYNVNATDADTRVSNPFIDI